MYWYLQGKVGNYLSKMKYVFFSLALLTIIIIIVRLISGEDDWICQDGRWIKHGKPNAPIPQKECQ